MSQTQTVPVFVNQTMKFLLRSPIHWLVSKTVLLISFTGCKSGNTYTTPVSYSQFGNHVTIFTHAPWWKNLCDNKSVRLRMRGKEFQGIANSVADDKQAIATALINHLRHVPGDAKWYGVTHDDFGDLSVEDVEIAVKTVVMVPITLC